MTPAAWITFALVAGFVWGGALFLVSIALRKERAKGQAAEDRPELFVP